MESLFPKNQNEIQNEIQNKIQQDTQNENEEKNETAEIVKINEAIENPATNETVSILKDAENLNNNLGKQKKNKKIYLKRDVIAAFFCIIPAYIFISNVFLAPNSLYGMIFNFIVLLIAIFYIKNCGEKLKPVHIFLFTLSFLFSLTYIISGNSLSKIVAGIFSYLLTIYTVFLATSGREAFERSFVSVFFRAVLFVPFKGFEDAPNAMTSVFKRKKKTKKLGQIIAGLFISIPITVIVGGLLVSADDNFGNLINNIFENLNISSLFEFGFKLFFSLPFAFFLFGALYANVKRKNNLNPTPDCRIIPPFFIFSAITPICILYTLFFFIQFNYFISAFQGMLPEEFTYANYARQGFFELCTVSAINFVILIIINVAGKKEENRKSLGINIFSGLISFFTIVLIITAISKMVMYINVYGLSPLRVYTSWFMLLLILIFASVIIWGFILKRNFYKPVFAVFTLMLGILCFFDIDGYIAKYNIEMYKSGQNSELDVDLFYDLSDSAMTYTVEMADDDSIYGTKIRDYLSSRVRATADRDWSYWNFSDEYAHKTARDCLRSENGGKTL